MIVREKAPRYIALTWQEFCHHISYDGGGWLPRDAVVMGHRCEQNTTKSGYFVYNPDGSFCVMNEDSVILFLGNNSEHAVSLNSNQFWEEYEMVVFK